MHTNPNQIGSLAMAPSFAAGFDCRMTSGPSVTKEVGSMKSAAGLAQSLGLRVLLMASFLLLTAACGSDSDDGSTTGDDTGTEASATLCYAPTPNQATRDRAQTGSLYDDTKTDCDIESYRKTENNEDTADRIRRARVASFPPSVIANPQECQSPRATDGSSALRVNSVYENVELGNEPNANVFAMYLEGELLTYEDPQTVINEIAALDGELPRFAPDTTASDTATASGSGVPMPTRLFAVESDDDDDDDVIDSIDFDPLALSNQLAELGYDVQPNYVFARTPGAQHSPANEPVPSAMAVDPRESGFDLAGLSVAILDSDFNYPPTEGTVMRLSAGHLTFVAGIVAQKAKEVDVRENDFALGEELSEALERGFLPEWDFLRLVLANEGDDDIGRAPFPDVLNLSAGGYVCEKESGEGIPFATRAAINTLRERGTVLVAAAGNDGELAPELKFWPAAAADIDDLDDLVVGVKATDGAGMIAPFSNELPEDAACALGVDVRSSYPIGEYGYSSTDDASIPQVVGVFEGAAIWSGTSFATPHVTVEFLKQLADLRMELTNEGFNFDDTNYRTSDRYLGGLAEIVDRLNESCPSS